MNLEINNTSKNSPITRFTVLIMSINSKLPSHPKPLNLQSKKVGWLEPFIHQFLSTKNLQDLYDGYALILSAKIS